jgi:ELWxxDGT repeat protein
LAVSRNRAIRPAVAAIAAGILTAGLAAGPSAAAPGDVSATVSAVAEINMGPGGSAPTDFEVIGNTAFFQATDGMNGIELWKIDPPYTSATMVENISADTNSIPSELTNVNGTLFFAATGSTGTTGKELWKSEPPYDAGSTNLVADIRPGMDVSSNPTQLYNFNGTLYFRANDGTNGDELWRSGGGPLGMGATETRMVKDINSGSATDHSQPGDFEASGGTLFFAATDSVNGRELWKTDGTTANTLIVNNINPMADSSPDDLTDVNGTLLFSADDGTNGNELWKSDGTSTTLIDINDTALAQDSFPSDLYSGNGTLYFAADNGIDATELWKSGGGAVCAVSCPADATQMVADIHPGAGNSSDPNEFAMFGDTLYFQADDGTDLGGHGIELWKSDGTTATLVKDIYPGVGNSGPHSFRNVNGVIFFSAEGGPMIGRELWRSDGTAAGTMQAADLNPSGIGSLPGQLTVAGNDTLLFQADNGTNGIELWKATVTVEGPAPVVTPPATPKKKCKKGRKLKKGKCVKKKRKKK